MRPSWNATMMGKAVKAIILNLLAHRNIMTLATVRP
jgi:hypothetical protein